MRFSKRVFVVAVLVFGLTVMVFAKERIGVVLYQHSYLPYGHLSEDERDTDVMIDINDDDIEDFICVIYGTDWGKNRSLVRRLADGVEVSFDDKDAESDSSGKFYIKKDALLTIAGKKAFISALSQTDVNRNKIKYIRDKTLTAINIQYSIIDFTLERDKEFGTVFNLFMSEMIYADIAEKYIIDENIKLNIRSFNTKEQFSKDWIIKKIN